MARILIVEDNPPVREVIELMCQNLGHKVTSSSGVGEFFSYLSKGKFDIILADWEIGRDHLGTDVLEHAARVHPKACRILMSGYKPTSVPDWIDAFLLKPVKLERLEELFLAHLPSSGHPEES